MRNDFDLLVDKVAYAIGREVAKKTVATDRELRRLDGLGKASAVHTLAERMAGELDGEARAAVLCVVANRHLFYVDQQPPETAPEPAGAANGQAS